MIAYREATTVSSRVLPHNSTEFLPACYVTKDLRAEGLLAICLSMHLLQEMHKVVLIVVKNFVSQHSKGNEEQVREVIWCCSKETVDHCDFE